MSTLTLDPAVFEKKLQGTPLFAWSDRLMHAVESRGHALKHGHLEQWELAVDSLPCSASPCAYRISNGAVHIECGFDSFQYATAKAALLKLRPWRKGPFSFDSIYIDAEWHSDWKWSRLAPHIQSLSGRRVLDVGCGNGYYLWRMQQAGACHVLGIDPSIHSLKQFDAAQRYIQSSNVMFLPLAMENLPENMQSFDTVFSMGVLYHRRDPESHLSQLNQSMDRYGELVLETLVIAGGSNETLQINDRYANMRNVYELPTLSRLSAWLQASGFEDLRIISLEQTSVTEQRSTEWMVSHSLEQALDPDDSSKTVEGYPRPLRAILLAKRAR
ncbi:MAG: tRNA 5-methoxyuridine(34)/uridine 5-oxyacetic acid(34) synthase CmoB [Granulosicoccus sp.]|nr:tRNA 5-methoxyuridine(34)/uridine 5-oxyacetic acid(34) synthase CmoB [Granulosicoccus sp.]